jgi:hypothetical protein
MGESPDVEPLRVTGSGQCTLEDDYNDDESPQVEPSNNDNSKPQVEADDSESPPAAKKHRKEKANNPAKGSIKDILVVVQRMEKERSGQEMENLACLKKCRHKEWK